MSDFCPHGYDEEQIKRDYCKACSINKIKDLEKFIDEIESIVAGKDTANNIELLDSIACAFQKRGNR